MPSHSIYLSLGSNLGDRLANLRAAIGVLRASGVTLKRTSSVYETEPVDLLDQPWFLNCVIEAETSLDPLLLLHALQAIETQMGRRKKIPKGPRLIDLDILLHGSETISTPELQIPHPRLHLRRFVLVPLAELAPNLTHPSWPAPVSDLLAQVQDTSQLRRIDATL